ncbi:MULTISPECIES: 2-succinyl-6-hydroxy-2,4-cyclohexadiene-1-carboxylate synthase [Providencia]|uniref:2-succinyl-6-hydroxy-2,4-cyclohexadiene-1-carboxylate synthase n=1 Tax=Providencia huaxiensis TaxID=2027290 RepID=A0ABU2IXI1_9GAMM|nr:MULTISPECIES: 2-succinyl-6-hydroxy-2,4-cyclohexadiene-1-carboxylate synthase [Providencia]MBZ3680285.1 2-succinyl-6-hydroxy-2,4-cyclohexadiene-1-carboxylate synthase [Providencia rettgeri]AXH61030.1 2-succinyl-6-hydroxy-2,4-cyclohexadiene-1-carboxylate synthase [Providencia huaxiensis]MDT0133345.1 2-succinyl-6-hydroxy-2,4-cyclohexadiene-1-carboxylate synthase [Providencia huaxiensis]MDT1979751.1 2-succinyl-6-hydroxy-2,4-cyclohexadiene-1-carboxylate synthase [Providencia huaxiensis]QLR02757.
MLSAQIHHSASSAPWIIYLHGLLGSADDWLPVIEQTCAFPSLAVDLPGHGGSHSEPCLGFSHFDQQLSALLQYHQINEYYLVGYSLGARLAMHFACYYQPNGLLGLVIEGGNVGLVNEKERIARAANDAAWAQRFRSEPIEEVLDDWYQQTVFADLSVIQRQRLIQLRRQNNPQSIAAMLENTSLAKQPFLADKLRKLTCPYRYFCGEKDQKFRSVSQQYALPLTLIENAGHNAHRENPMGFATALHHFLSHCG